MLRRPSTFRSTPRGEGWFRHRFPVDIDQVVDVWSNLAERGFIHDLVDIDRAVPVSLPHLG